MQKRGPSRGLVWLAVAVLIGAATFSWLVARRPAAPAGPREPLRQAEPAVALGSQQPAASGAEWKGSVAEIEPVKLNVPAAQESAASKPEQVASANSATASVTATVGVTPETSEREATVQAVRVAATTYDAAAAAEVAKYLNHPDPEVRAEAVRAMVVAGDAAGAALLRKASEQIKDPREAVTYLDAADFLELPPALPLGERGR